MIDPLQLFLALFVYIPILVIGYSTFIIDFSKPLSDEKNQTNIRNIQNSILFLSIVTTFASIYAIFSGKEE